MGCILLPLFTIVIRQYRIVTKLHVNNGAVKILDYWLLQFPFEIHFGWICAAFALNLNIVAVNLSAGAEAQVAVAAISLAALALAALTCLGLRFPQFTLPWVVVWATVRLKVYISHLLSVMPLF